MICVELQTEGGLATLGMYSQSLFLRLGLTIDVPPFFGDMNKTPTMFRTIKHEQFPSNRLANTSSKFL